MTTPLRERTEFFMYLEEAINRTRYPYGQGTEGTLVLDDIALGIQVHIAMCLTRSFFAVVQGAFFTIGQAVDHKAPTPYVPSIGIGYGQG